jgi:hypothetical protein
VFGHVGQMVTASAFGFPSSCAQPGVTSGCKVSLYWSSESLGDGTDFFLRNATVGANGQFNQSVTFLVPHAFGGIHPVEALSAYNGVSFLETSEPSTDITNANFTVAPQLTLSNTTVNANVEGSIAAHGTGFNSGATYAVIIDHSFYTEVLGGLNGDLQVNFTSAGFQPGIHQVALVVTPPSNDSFPVASAYFNVTTTGDYTSNEISALSSILAGWNSTLAAWTTTFSSVNATLTSLNTMVSGLVSSVGGLTYTLSGIVSTLNGITGSASKAASEATTAATEATAAAASAASIQSALATTSNWVLVVAVLAAITLVLELAIALRKIA